MSWVPIREDLPEDPAVISIAAALGMDEDHVVGKLAKVWNWFSSQTIDGVASVTVAWVNKLTATPGFAEAMTKEGWLVEQDGKLAMPKFDRWISESAKQRLQAALRKKRERAKLNRASRNDRDNVAENVTPTEQKRTEQDSQSPVLSDQIQKSDSEQGREGLERRKRPSVFDSLTLQALTDATRLREWFETQGKARKPILSQSRESWEIVCAAACEAVAEGDIPIARFKYLVTKGQAEIQEKYRIAGRAFAKRIAA